MATLVIFESFALALGTGLHNLATDTFKVALTNTAPTAATDDQFADITEIAAGNGYTAGGTDIQNGYTQTGGVGTMTAVDVVFTASGGSIGPFRYAVIYNDTAAGKELLGYYDRGSSLTLNDGDTFTVDFGASLYTFTASV